MPFDVSLVVAPFRMQPGLRRIARGHPQLTPSLPGGRHLRAKTAVLAAFAAKALVSTPRFDAEPVFATLAEEAAQQTPVAFSFDAIGECRAPLLGWALVDNEPLGEGDPGLGQVLRGLAPEQRTSALASLAFAEDFAVIDGDDTTIPWLAVCLPSRWAPEEKIGLPFAAVHAPVADGDLLRAAGAGLATLVTGEQRWERFVWTFSADPRLAQHPSRGLARWPAQADAAGLAAAAWLRSERQTFLPIAGSRQAVFTIHVESEPLVDAVADADAATRLHAALASMSPAVLAYRDLAGARDRLLEWLAWRAVGGT